MGQRNADTALEMSARGQPSSGKQSAAVRRIAFVTGPGHAPGPLHRPLFEAITGLGHMVLCLAPVGDPVGDKVSGPVAGDSNIEFGSFDPAPEGWSFLQSRRAVQALSVTLKDWRAHGVVSTGAQTALLTGVAAEQAGIRECIAVMSECFDTGNAAMVQAWGKALAVSSAAVFFNRDDQQAAVKAGVLAKQMPAFVVPGAGVDLTALNAVPLPAWDGGLVFLMHAPAGQPAQGKIVVEAATAMLITHPTARVMLTGVTRGKDQTLPERMSFSSDERAALAQCHVYVHVPGNEAMPARLLDALAAGRPIITTNTPGCRDTVDDFVNGCLVEPGSATALLLAMKIFVTQPDLLRPAANASRLKAERWFDQRDVNQRWLKALALMA